MSLININKQIIFFASVFLINNALSTKKIMILEGDQLDSQIKLANQKHNKLFLIFYVNNCQYCKMALKILKTQIIKNFEDVEEVSFGSIDLDQQKNIWIGLRFNITKIPYIILIENNKMFLYQKSFEANTVIEFIKEEKNIEDALDIPKEMTFLNKFKSAMEELSEKIEKVLEKFGMNKTWGIKLAYFFVIVGIISFFYLEKKLFDLCKYIFGEKNMNVDNTISRGENKNDNNINDEKEKED